jgi:hypothetical protein
MWSHSTHNGPALYDHDWSSENSSAWQGRSWILAGDVPHRSVLMTYHAGVVPIYVIVGQTCHQHNRLSWLVHALDHDRTYPRAPPQPDYSQHLPSSWLVFPKVYVLSFCMFTFYLSHKSTSKNRYIYRL